MKKRWKSIYILILLCLFMVTACGSKRTVAEESRDCTIQEYYIPGIQEYCMDEKGEYLFVILKGQSSIYQYSLDGTMVCKYDVDADAEYKDRYGYLGERPLDADNLRGLCIDKNSLFCYRNWKGTILEINLDTGIDRVAYEVTAECGEILRMIANEQKMFLHLWTGEYDTVRSVAVIDRESGEFEFLKGCHPEEIAMANRTDIWLESMNDMGEYYFQRYNGEDESFSEQYILNVDYPIEDIVYDEQTQYLYGYQLETQSFTRLSPSSPLSLARFEVKQIYSMTGDFGITLNNGRMYIQDDIEEKIYSFLPDQFIHEDTALKGYVLESCRVSDWDGYQIDLERIDWEEMALKLLAEDSDFDFVVISTRMPEILSIRNAMAYYPIPEEYISDYLEKCFPYVKEASTYRGDIWMLPLNLNTSVLAYNEEKLAEYDIYMESLTDYNDFSEAGKCLFESGQEGHYGGLYASGFLEEYINNSQDAENIDFNTQEFYKILEYLESDEYGINAPFRNSWIIMDQDDYHEPEKYSNEDIKECEIMKWTAFYQNIFFCKVGLDEFETNMLAQSGCMHLCRVPTFDGSAQPIPMVGDVLIINPNSKHIGETLNFASDMASVYIENKYYHLSSERELYGESEFENELYEIFCNGIIEFAYPEDIFESYSAYLMNLSDMKKEELAMELNRKIRMFYGE